MTGKTLVISVLLVVGVLAAGWTQSDGEKLTATWNLSGEVKEIRHKELAVVFSEDMVALGAKTDGAAFLKLEPECQGEYLWRGTKTLVFKPKGRFRYSTRYRAAIPAGIRSLREILLEKKISGNYGHIMVSRFGRESRKWLQKRYIKLELAY